MTLKAGRRPRSAAQIEATRTKIVAGAQKLFQEEGFDSVSIRRLAKEVRCAPMTIYAHFDGKIDILKHLWAVVLESVFAGIRLDIEAVDAPDDRLKIAVRTFVKYWIDHPDHFRLVFMSNDITRPDVSAFIKDEATLAHFRFFFDLVAAALPSGAPAKTRTDAIISSMIGIVFCANTIKDYPWTDAQRLTDLVTTNLLTT